MPKIVFRVLASAEQLEEITEDFRRLFAAMGEAVDATFTQRATLPPDPQLLATWVEVFGTTPAEAHAEGAELVVEVRRYDMGSISGLCMHLAELLTTRDKTPAEPLLRQVADVAGHADEAAGRSQLARDEAQQGRLAAPVAPDEAAAAGGQCGVETVEDDGAVGPVEGEAVEHDGGGWSRHAGLPGGCRQGGQGRPQNSTTPR